MAFWNRRKPIDNEEPLEDHHVLKRTLSWPHLMAMGIGAIIGTGIFALIGVGAGMAGPSVVVSFAVVGVVCACAAMAYAEMSTMIPASGSAYTYTYAVLGEFLGWVVGWCLILEYSLVVSAVAVGWSGYAVGFLKGLDIVLPTAMTVGPHVDGGFVNAPAIFIIMVVAGLLMLGTRESARINTVLVLIKLAALGLFVAVAWPAFDAANFEPFAPFGYGKTQVGDVDKGMIAAASIIFFAFYGFDAISTAAEEAKDPGKDLSIGIIGSMIICTIIYMAVAAVAVGALPFGQFADSPEPLALILREIGQGDAAKWIAGAAIVAMPTVLLAFLYGQSRIFFVMARDGLLPRALSRVNPKTGTPVVMTLVAAVVVAALAGVARLDEIAALANAGTLAAFIAVAVCMLVMRVREPNRPRVFKTPFGWLVGIVTIVGCAYLFWGLQWRTQQFFMVWTLVGLVVYFGYAMHASRLKGK